MHAIKIMLGIIMYDTHTSVLSTAAPNARIRYVRSNVPYSTLLNKFAEIRSYTRILNILSTSNLGYLNIFINYNISLNFFLFGFENRFTVLMSIT
jgi:hypothetical protein